MKKRAVSLKLLSSPCLKRRRLAARHRTGHGGSHFNVLFLCTGNSARSIMAEAILNKIGAGKFRAYSAGSQPKGRVNPHPNQTLQSLRHYHSSISLQSWTDFPTPP